jgi:acetolactate synthase-1/2/3 large subunit
MGFAIPASIGGCIATGYKRIISVDGDGGFQLNIQELQIVKSLNLPIKYFVINNQGYAAIRAMQRNHFHGHLVGCDISSGVFLPNILSIAEAYGISSSRICNDAHLRQRIREVLDAPGPVVCEVLIDPDELVYPKVTSEVCPDGSMRSRPLEDMWPLLDRSELEANMSISKTQPAPLR